MVTLARALSRTASSRSSSFVRNRSETPRTWTGAARPKPSNRARQVSPAPRSDRSEPRHSVPKILAYAITRGNKVLVVASISSTRRLRMIKEVEVDPDGSLTRRWGTRADDVRVKRTMAALEANGMTVLRAPDAAAAKGIVLDLIPDASPVHQGASQTLDVLGITSEVEKSGRYAALRPRIWSLNRETEADEIRRLGAAPDVMLGR